MFLKSLELQGFKSFADRTEIVFERGLTAIVGPNGCGKSNVVDAIRWSLGEQSAKSLRGGVMTDVIFNGGGKRGPSSFAEVTLTFDNADRALPVERDTVRVTRRLYRSGESEYILDGKPSRLRDIRELLLDTGAGSSAATFVEQGKIAALLHASNDERRHVLEEAAGIGKYKIRKKESLERLAGVEGDRKRLQDLLQEVIRQHEEVKKQAEKAGRYVEVRDRLRSVRTLLARHKRAAFEKRMKEARQRAEKAHVDRAQAEAHERRLSGEAETLAGEKRARESRHRNDELEIRDIGAAIDGRKRELDAEKKRVQELREDRKRVEEAISSAKERVQALEKEIAEGRKAIDECRVKDSGLGERLSLAEERVQALEGKAAAATALVERLKNELFQRMTEESRARNAISQLEMRLQVQQSRRARLSEKKAVIGEDVARRERDVKDLLTRGRTAEARAKELEEGALAAESRRRTSEQALRAGEEEFLAARKRMGEVEARLAALEKLEKEGAGLEPGVLALTKWGDERLLGPVADLLSCDRRFALAVEAALGARAQWVVARTKLAAQEGMRWLSSANKGRAALVAIEGIVAPEVRMEPLAHEGFLGWASDLAGVRGEGKAVVERMLEGTAVVKDLDAAVALADTAKVWRCVTLGGELVEADGAHEAGVSSAQGRVQRVAERQELAQQVAWGEADLHARGKALDRAKAALKEAEAELSTLKSERDEARLSASSLRSRREEIEKGLAITRVELTSCASELEEIEEEVGRAAESMAAVQKELTSADGKARELEAAVAAQEKQARAIDTERTSAREERDELRLRHARGAEQLAGYKAALARAERDLAEHMKGREGLKLDLETAEERLQGSKDAIERLKVESAALAGEKELREERYAVEAAALTELSRRLDEARKGAEEAAAARQRAEAALADGGRVEQETKARLEDLASRLRDDLGIELSSLEPIPEPKPGEPAWNEAGAEREATSLRGKLEEMGPVNLEALEECERLQGRRQTLTTQLQDIEGAEENLRAAIRKINETSRKLFLETFEAVRENFQHIYRKLFGGGKADLRLEEGKDVLEAGVEVISVPPGKQPRVLIQLSGGEQTLTTVALLFAVFRSKPSPFCLLDEVDAALDEHNVGRFVALVREFLDRSQFLIITHNKRTMKAADALYGVTMPEPGVSAPVSVRLGGPEELPLEARHALATAHAPAPEPVGANVGAGGVSLPPGVAAAS